LLKRLVLTFSPSSFFLFLFLSLSLNALTLTINVGREETQNFSTLHVKEDIAFTCTDEKDDYDKIVQVTCVFPREPKEKFEEMQTNFFKIDSYTKNGRYYVRIYPTQKIEAFPIGFTLYEDLLYMKKEAYTLLLKLKWQSIGQFWAILSNFLISHQK